MSEEKKERRICIMGTAPTWRSIPFDDPTLEIWALNDAWVLNPPRASVWFDLHPFDKMWFRPREQRKVFAGDIPPGFFVRPEGHLDWLRKQSIPVYVQDAKLLGSPNARTFPVEECLKLYPTYCSSPAWMVALALLEGATELHIYGIHLATEWEYINQRPNFEALLTLAAARGVKVVLAKGCPLLRGSHLYGFEEDPETPKVALKRKAERIRHEQVLLKQRHEKKADPNYTSRMAMLSAQLLDTQLAIQHVMAGKAPVGL